MLGNYGAAPSVGPEGKSEVKGSDPRVHLPFGCMDHAPLISAQLKKRKDCPKDATSAWIQRLFPSQDGVNFVANQIHSDPISRLDPKTMWGNRRRNQRPENRKGKAEP